jgi:hypothetical protein
MLKFFGKLNNLVGNMDSLTNYLSPEQKPGQTNLTQVIQNSGVLTSAQQDELQRVVDSGGGAITYLMAEAAKGLGRIDNMERLVVNMASDMHEMNINMHEMNIKMGIMSYDVDSTMGRMGRWMPW